MHRPTDIPDLAIVRALTSGGPYAENDAISIAFVTPKIGRLVAHEPRAGDANVAADPKELLPETISAIVTHGAGPYACDDIVTLSFVDPSVARVHPSTPAQQGTRPFVTRTATIDLPKPSDAGAAPMRIAAPGAMAESESSDVPVAQPAVAATASDFDIFEMFERRDAETARLATVASPMPQHAEPAAPLSSRGVRITLSWSDERARRFIQVTDKLFTVDRLGWYRHAFAMRLLVPDEITCGDGTSDAEIGRHLRSLRSSALETLGRPLLAAFMPAFSVTSDWLDSIDSADGARALSGLRGALLPYAANDTRCETTFDATTTHGVVHANDLAAAPASIEAMLPLLIANVSAFDDVTDRLSSYRQALIELFGGTAQSAETVRLGQMAQPNHTLDDRLWQLVGAVGERFGGLAVA